jgi:hypothetical protein
MLSAPPRWVDASQFLDSEWDELCGAHRALGGVDELAGLRKVASDHALREACEQFGRARNAVVATIFERLDPSKDTTVFREAWLAAALDERDEGLRALHALTSVEFRNFLTGDPTQDGCIEAAHASATRRRWSHIASTTNAVITSQPRRGYEAYD